MSHSEVFVIGAGPAGLTASYLLTKQGISTTVIEADPDYVGGISRTANYKDFLFDIGGHRFFSRSKEVVDLWKEILPQDFITRPRMSRIYYDGKYYSYPLKAFEALGNLGVVESAMCVLSFMYKQAFPNEKPETFHDWVANQFGERLFSIFFKTYTEKVWGMSCDEISADWAAQRIKGLDLWSAMANALRNSVKPKGFKDGTAANDGEVIKTLIESFQYPRKGPGMMWDAAAARRSEQGGKIHMGTRSDQPQLRCQAVAFGRSLRRHRSGEAKTFTSRHVISSAPIRELVHAFTRTAGLRGRRRQAALSRFHHCRARRQQTGSVSRQLDLYPRAERQSRTHPEFPLLVAGDGAGRETRLPRARILLLRGRRALDFELTRSCWRSARRELAKIGLATRGRMHRRLRRASKESLSGL